MVQGTPERLPPVKKTVCRLAEENICHDVELEAIYEVVQLKGAIIRWEALEKVYNMSFNIVAIGTSNFGNLKMNQESAILPKTAELYMWSEMILAC